MTDPYQVLGLLPDSDDGTIRKRYLELVKKHPPERDPEKFTEIRKAYDQLRDLPTRIRTRLFEARTTQDLDTIIEDLECRKPRPRLSLEKLLAMVRRS